MQKLKPLDDGEAGIGYVGCYVGLGGLLLLIAGGIFRWAFTANYKTEDGPGEFVLIAMAALIFGVVSIGAGIRLAHSFTRFGKCDGMVNAEILHPGDSFDFSFRQELKRDVDVRAIHVYFVFRERVSFREDDSSAMTNVNLDRLIDRVTLPGRKFSSMWPIIFQHKFQIPRRHIFRRNSLMHHLDAKAESLYIIKVHLDADEPDGDCTDCLWKSFQVEVTPDPMASPYPAGPAPEGIYFDLILEESDSSNRCKEWEKVFHEVLPFIRETKTHDVFRAIPCVLIEKVPLEEAEAARKRLEEAGFRVSCRLTEAKG